MTPWMLKKGAGVRMDKQTSYDKISLEAGCPQVGRDVPGTIQ